MIALLLLCSAPLLLLSCQGPAEVAQSDTPPVTLVEQVPVIESPSPKVTPEPAAPPRPELHSVFDLIDNRHLAHRQVAGGLYIEAGAPGFARYIHGNRDRQWVLNETHEERSAALPRRRETSLAVPLTASQAESAGVVQVELWYGSGRYPFELSINETSLGELDLESGWQVVTLPIPEGLLVAGENSLQLDFPSDATRSSSRTRGALTRVFIGPLAVLGVGDDEIEPLAAAGAMGAARRLRLTPESGLATYLVLPPSPWLSFQLVEPSTSTSINGCHLSAEISTEDGGRFEYGAALDRSRQLALSQQNDEVVLHLDEAPFDEVVRLELGVSAECPTVTVSAAEIRTQGPAPREPTFEPPRNVVVWLVDTLRADRLSTIRHDTRVQTPNFERFASEGAVFTRAYVQGNESFASHAAIFSGRYPVTTGVRSSRDHVDDDELLLAELAREAGLFTGGYSANGHIRAGNGFEQGFRTYVNALRDNYRYRAPGMCDHATRWVDEHMADPFYLYIGTVDSHVTYRAHDDILPLYDPDPYHGPFQNYVSGEELGQIKGGSMRVTARDRVRIEAIYDDTVTFNDRYFGLFLEHLEELGILDETAIIVTSDHGDEFWEHDSVGHGHSVYDELVHVPLLIRYPAAIPAGTVVSRGVDAVDILPTLGDLLGVEVPPAIQGESLLPLIHGTGAEYPRPAFSQQYGHTAAMSLQRWKVIWRSEGRRRLYDVWEDPTEQRDVAELHPYALRFTSDAMGLFMAYQRDWSKREWGVASNLSSGFQSGD